MKSKQACSPWSVNYPLTKELYLSFIFDWHSYKLFSYFDSGKLSLKFGTRWKHPVYLEIDKSSRHVNIPWSDFNFLLKYWVWVYQFCLLMIVDTLTSVYPIFVRDSEWPFDCSVWTNLEFKICNGEKTNFLKTSDATLKLIYVVSRTENAVFLLPTFTSYRVEPTRWPLLF